MQRPHRWGGEHVLYKTQSIRHYWGVRVIGRSPRSSRCDPAGSRSAGPRRAATWPWPPRPGSAAGPAGPWSSAAPGGAPGPAPPGSASRPRVPSDAPNAPSPHPSACGWRGPVPGPFLRGWVLIKEEKGGKGYSQLLTNFWYTGFITM